MYIYIEKESKGGGGGVMSCSFGLGLNNIIGTWSETYFRHLFPAYLVIMRQFQIVIFRLKSISDLDSGSLPRFIVNSFTQNWK